MPKPDDVRTDAHAGDGVVICTSCSTPNYARNDFCRKCAAPLSALSTADPIGTIYAEADCYRKAIANPYKPIVLIGMWALFGPWAVVGTITLVGSLRTGPVFGYSPSVWDVLGLIFLGVFVLGLHAYPWIVLLRVTRNYMRLGRARRREEALRSWAKREREREQRERERERARERADEAALTYLQHPRERR